jgi:RraA family protein
MTIKTVSRQAPVEAASTRPKSAEMTPGPGFRVRLSIERPDPRLIAMFRDYETTDISDILNRTYTMSPDIRNVVNEEPLVGPACTVKVFPSGNLMVHKALDVAKPGDIVVVDTSGSQRNAVLGDLVTNKAKHRGIAGFVVDGLVRDLPGLIDAGLPVYARGITPHGPLHRGPGELNYTISCGGIVVNPGDIIVADRNGIAVVRREFAEETVDRLKALQARIEVYVRNVKAGKFSNAWVDALLNQERCLIE